MYFSVKIKEYENKVMFWFGFEINKLFLLFSDLIKSCYYLLSKLGKVVNNY